MRIKSLHWHLHLFIQRTLLCKAVYKWSLPNVTNRFNDGRVLHSSLWSIFIPNNRTCCCMFDVFSAGHGLLWNGSVCSKACSLSSSLHHPFFVSSFSPVFSAPALRNASFHLSAGEFPCQPEKGVVIEWEKKRKEMRCCVLLWLRFTDWDWRCYSAYMMRCKQSNWAERSISTIGVWNKQM